MGIQFNQASLNGALTQHKNKNIKKQTNNLVIKATRTTSITV